MAYEPTRSGAKSLLVFVPGLLAERVPYAELLSRLEQDLGQGWRVLWWDSGLRWWSRRPMAEAGHRLRVRLRAEWDDIGGFKRIVLVGHSLGGVVVRHAYLLDSGAYADVLGPHEWVAKVERIVLLAAPNRGFQMSNLPFVYRWLLRLFGGPLGSQWEICGQARPSLPHCGCSGCIISMPTQLLTYLWSCNCSVIVMDSLAARTALT